MDLKGLQCEMGANDKLYSRPPASLMTRHDLLSLHSPAMFVPRFFLLARTMGTHAVMFPKTHIDIENKDMHNFRMNPKGVLLFIYGGYRQ